MITFQSLQEDAENVHSRKRGRRETIVGPAVDKGVAHEDVGLKPVSLVPKEIPVIRKKNPVLQVHFFKIHRTVSANALQTLYSYILTADKSCSKANIQRDYEYQ